MLDWHFMGSLLHVRKHYHDQSISSTPLRGSAYSPKLPKRSTLLTLLTVGILVFLAIPLGLQSGLFDPIRLHFLLSAWTPRWATPLAIALISLLIIIPVAWVVLSDVLDLVAFFLVQNALLIVGYFFLPVTAWKLTPDLATGIMQAGPVVLLINAIGFSVLLITLSLTYLLGKLRHVRMQPLRDTPEAYDLRVKWFLRVAGIAILCILAMPMLRTGIIPLLAEDSAVARAANMESDLQRSLYNLGTALMPFISAGLLMLCYRRPLRLLGIDGMTAASLFLVQLLSGNRFPLAITAFAAFTLITMERHLPRFLLLGVFAGCMFFFTDLSGFTGMLRTQRDQLSEGNPVTKSLEAAFTGDNLIDVRDAAWVISRWDFDPLMGKTYLGGLVSMMPSGLFPQKKEWHLGLTGVRIVGWDPESHFGLRITFFGESFLNFGLAGVITLGMVLGILFGTLLRAVHQAAEKRPPCLHYNLKLVVLMQMCMPLANTSDAFTFWALCGFLLLQWLSVDCTLTASWPLKPSILNVARST
jgi:oligosaccharide repeat unit polymerase